ncbi:DUF3488 and transglutaminase-like domain-containing protein [Cyanobium sp. Morenito 9A2]|uniref:DUF3488 and transglutaminase-like domain-containing protein n=1 Tax=Cyanobium sp. Morenito 9A2 TaxID=2823718 RepID=UPI0020CB6BE6|nr:DUF3488 and transglutaminase-like domain-containing protein [Cyanobium sp. Morenito 9A2]MCP9850013.1 DUF3488 domain-containing protein [Cyanobium sp. Morenito 9A2]
MRPAHGPLSPRAIRLQQIGLGSLVLQVVMSDRLHPLFWGVTVLVVLAALKLRETRRPSELQHSALTQLLALGVLAVVNPGLATSLLQGATALVAIGAIVCQELGAVPPARRVLGQTLRLLGASIPLMLLLFLLLPRLGPLWQLPQNQTGRTGLSDQLDPGGLSTLVRDASPALRVSFGNDPPPPARERYWRVLVLDGFDGWAWGVADRQPKVSSRPSPTAPAAAKPEAREGVQLWLLEPWPLPQLPWSGAGVPASPELRTNDQGVLRSQRLIGDRPIYTIRRTEQAGGWRQRPPSPQQLQLPWGSNPRLEALGQSWGQLASPRERVKAAESWYRQRPFRYTLDPGRLPRLAPLDAFLFQSQQGFCEHYAASFTALMRAAGVPARVVVGYQGGEWVGPASGGEGYLDVRQSDAHSWSDVWLGPEGWVRVDPTGWVDPARIERGLAGSLADRPGELALLRLGPAWLRQLGQRWGSLDLLWTRWMLGFDGPAQQAWLGQWLGPWKDWQGVLLLVTMAGAVGGTLLVLHLLDRWQQRPGDRLRRELERSLRPLGRLGLTPMAGESLEAFCARVGERHPSLTPPLKQLERRYSERRFAPPGQRQRAARRKGQPGHDLATAIRRLQPSWLEHWQLPRQR